MILLSYCQPVCSVIVNHLSFLADKIVMQAFSTALGEINMLEKLAMNLGLFLKLSCLRGYKYVMI